MIKIIHIGAYNRNVGDNIALLNARKSWEEQLGEINWINQDIGQYWNPGLTIEVLKQHFAQLGTMCDAILVGGGGLVEYGGYETNATGYKLPFNKEILQAVGKPVFFHGVGINIFRGGIDYSDKAKQALQETIDYSAGFSVRNDGSFEKIQDWIKLDTTNVSTIPDPGLLFLKFFNIPKKNVLAKGAFQPAFNSSQGINIERFRTQENIEWVKEFSKDFICYPHTPKDYGRIPATPVVDEQTFNTQYTRLDQTLNFLQYYKKVDYVVAMRGHGQLITIGMNIPGIYFTTQDKVRDFSLLNGYEEYNVDILDEDWQLKLTYLNNRIRKDSHFIDQWYDITESNMPKWIEMNQSFVQKSIANGL